MGFSLLDIFLTNSHMIFLPKVSFRGLGRSGSVVLPFRPVARCFLIRRVSSTSLESLLQYKSFITTLSLHCYHTNVVHSTVIDCW